MLKGPVPGKDIAILDKYVQINKAAYVKQKPIELQGEIDRSAV